MNKNLARYQFRKKLDFVCNNFTKGEKSMYENALIVDKGGMYVSHKTCYLEILKNGKIKTAEFFN